MTKDLIDLLPRIMTTQLVGSVIRTDGLAVAVGGFPAPVGALVEIERQAGSPLQGEFIGVRDKHTVHNTIGDVAGVSRANKVRMVRTSRKIIVLDAL